MNLKQSSIDFVRDNNCALHTPAELIQKAMEFGATEAIREATEFDNLIDEAIQQGE